jgi:hypothetical protein
MKTSKQLGLGSTLHMKKTIVFEELDDPQYDLPFPFKGSNSSPIPIDSPHNM